ncbi:PadR family transcriptional regulator [Rhizobium subbaraonis]|uniref:PadR family transcriptional regulator n=1 Tax=Rhizobium subbaraonis TaxID=908946 RepID=UPI001FE04D24|nr:PadR family transcriptional regulator [Rhizobium subbaraonis]
MIYIGIMKNHPHFFHRFFSPSDERSGSHEHHRHRRGGRHGGRLFDYGDLRLLMLAMIAKTPSHGYELIKSIEERFSGAYSPSPGVVYPTLAWLDDMGYARIDQTDGGRKRYSVTPEGEAFLAANQSLLDELLSRGKGDGEGGRRDIPLPVLRAMENLKLSLRLRLKSGPLDDAAAEKIAAALDQAAQIVERSR